MVQRLTHPLIITSALIVGCAVAWSGCTPSTKPCPCPAKAVARAGAKATKLKLFVMSKCPHGGDAERGVAGVMRALGDDLEVELDFIVGEKKGAFESLHGPDEVAGNIVQLCVAKRYSMAKTMSFIGCMNRRMRAIPHNWRTCARLEGIDVAAVKSCSEGAEGKGLLRASMARAKKAGASGSPTIHIAGKSYEGGRSPMDLLRAVCATMAKPPVACRQLPEPVAVTLTVLSDKRCGATCATDEYEMGLKARYLPKLTVKHLDYGSAEGKALYKKLGLRKLPALLFDKNLEKTEKFPMLRRFVRPRPEGYRELMVPAKWDPTAEICDNKKDDTGNGKVDCQDPTCKGKLVCRQEKKRELRAFVMSQCPYGAMAVLAMKEVLKNFKGQIDFDLHFIVERKPNGKFEAMHGASEMAENIRQLCAKKYYKKKNKYLDYVWCRARDYRSNNWQPCAKGAIKAKVIGKCSTGPEGVQLLADDIKAAEALGISASPTLLANNIHKFNAISAEDVKKGICKVNPKLAGCKNTLSKTQAPAGACGN